jgi:DNA-binding NarL/FixJ family response regulator
MVLSRAVLIIESDPNALSQMRRVLAGMKLSVMAASDDDSVREAIAYLQAKETPAILLIARVGLPSGSGIRLLEEAAEVFPEASQLVVSHYPKDLLVSVPRFLEHSDHFLQEEFTDEQFQRAVEEALARSTGAA